MIGFPQKTALINAVAGAVVSAALLSPQACFAFGERGHAGIFQGALRLLRATESCATPWTEYRDPSRAPTIWPDGAVKYNLEWIPPEISTVFETLGALNSGDHYFDPRSSHQRRPAGPWVFDDDDDPETPQTQRRFPAKLVPFRELFKKAIEGAHGTAPPTQFEELATTAGSSRVRDWDKGADGRGYNAVTSILFLLNGRAEEDTTNPTLLSPTRGFADLARSGQWKPAELTLGCAMHYVGDLASPGHTHWKSPWQLESMNPPLIDKRFYHPDHEDFDHLGDSFWTDARRRDKLSRLLDSAKPRLIRRFDSSVKVCTAKGRIWMTGPGDFAWDEDLPRTLIELARPSRSLWDDHWKFHGTANDFWAEGDFSGPCVDRFAAHLAGAVATAAGVIDWAFSMGTAEGKDKDGPYSRDATNFLGMAAALLSSPDASGAVLTPEALQGKDCYVGGVDRDDYFPISGSQVSRVSVAVKEGSAETVKAEVFDASGAPLPYHVKPATGSIDLYLGKAVDKFLLRVYSPSGASATYTISFPPADVEMIVEAEKPAVKRGRPIKFTGKVVDKAGKPVFTASVGVEDPLTQQTVVLPVGPQGSFSYACDNLLTKPGVYAFVFLCSQAPEQVHAVAVIDEGYRTVSLPKFQVPLGNWGTIAESFGTRPDVFASVTRTTTGQSPPAILAPPYAPPSQTSQMVAAARVLAEDLVAGSVEEFTSSPVTVGAVGVAIATCPFPDVTVTKAVCAGSVAYLGSAAVEAAAKTVFKKAIDLSDLSPPEKDFWKQRVDDGALVYDVFQLDPKAGLKSAKGIEQVLNVLAIQWDATQIAFQNLPTQSPSGAPNPSAYAVITLANGEVLAITARGPQPPSDKGMLDLVLCIDKSGSMVDDIQAVQEECDATLDALDQYAKTNNIDLRVGLVAYTRHDEPNWIQGNPLTSDVATIRRYIQGISITNLALGKGGNEDMYAALMYAMNEPVGGQKIAMGWRPGAAKIVIPIGDEPPDDPDWEERTLDDVALVARNLDPVHIYPLLTPKQGSTFLDPAVRAMERIAKATGGEVFRVASADQLPETVVAAVKLAVRQHRNEVWRKENPPYVLYGAIFGLLGLMALTTVGLILRSAIGGKKSISQGAAGAGRA